ncbi:MAG TPA: hypothetical protein VK864_09035 [Longimicrobiales bacterium]|nr:hypothetical protein [Longimicrobiales bacterium]
MKKWLMVSLAVLVVAPTAVDGQRQRRFVRNNGDCCYGNRFYLEPYAGAMKDAYDIGASGDTGYLLGLHVGYILGSRVRLLGNFGYSNAEDVADSQGLNSYYVYDNVWLMTTAGAEFDVVPGRTSAALGLQIGAGWRKLDLEETIGSPADSPLDDDRYAAYEMLLPSLTLRHWFSSRVGISAALRDHMFDIFDGTVQHSPAITLGVTWR